jgi:2,3-bisphosphoglycerate-dependent phosphoglycerate mutase
MNRLVLLRHGQSAWNLENRFTGWTDVGLSEQGEAEAGQAGRILKEKGYGFDMAFTSVLKRAIKTLWTVLEELDLMWIPVHCDWRLNERHYGALQGLDKKDAEKQYGTDQVHLWRRGYDVVPPALGHADLRHPKFDPHYRQLAPGQAPAAESLKETLSRVVLFWQQYIVPELKNGRQVIISAHGNSLRALVKHLDDISDEKIPLLEIPTGIPLVYELDGDFKGKNHFYLTDLSDRSI